ncbi:MAG TPA: DsbA family protein [Solirubrobacterales bacterium]
MPVEARLYTDPACVWSWATEPERRRLEWEFGDGIEFRPVMGGMARTIEAADRLELLVEWLEVSDETGMPTDPLIWRQNPLSSSYPACQAVKAAAEQGAPAALRYLRRLREGIMLGRRRLDHAEALIAEAGPAGLDRERFEIDLRSHAIVEAFGADLEEVRDPPDDARAAGQVKATVGGERVGFPSLVFAGERGEREALYGPVPYERLRAAAAAVGATPAAERPPEPLAAVERFGRLTTRELEALTQRPRPVLEAELWSLAREWRLKQEVSAFGVLWEAA